MEQMMKKHPGAAAVMAIILVSSIAVTAAVVTAGVSLMGAFPSMAYVEPSQAGLIGAAWIVMLVLWSVIATVIAGALHSAGQEANLTALRFEAKAGLRRRYADGELDTQEFDRVERDRAA
jgi:uncharacterized membrane protein